MSLSKKELETLLKLVGLTDDEEIHCEQCLALVAEFAEKHLAGKLLPEGLEAVEKHLAICAECCEEYEVLRKALGDLRGD